RPCTACASRGTRRVARLSQDERRTKTCYRVECCDCLFDFDANGCVESRKQTGCDRCCMTSACLHQAHISALLCTILKLPDETAHMCCVCGGMFEMGILFVIPDGRR